MTAPHADRDHSEAPDLLAALQRSIDAAKANRVARPVDADMNLDEPIPFMLADEPAGERVRWPLEEGDTGEALRVSISGHGPRITDCQHPDCVAARDAARRS